jgi:putrescine---pyruvate transaminase
MNAPLTNLPTAELQALDAAHHLHPFTHSRTLHERGVRIIRSARGVHLTDTDGNRILDGMSGLWNVNVGYGRTEIVDAVARQLAELPFYNTFFNTSHPPVIELGRLLSDVTPKQFSRFFFTGSGSESNDTIIRMVRYFWEVVGKPNKSIIISRKNGYHGSTMAGASLGGMAFMHKQGGLPIPGIVHAPQPFWWGEGGALSPDDFGIHVADQTLAIIDAIGPDNIGAMIAEPIQGAGGVIIPPVTYWPRLAAGLKQRDILLVSDEVICGFGRTGHWFGCEFFGTEPDLMAMAKGISSGYQPIGAVAVSDRIAEAFLAKSEDDFAHGYTYSGHPAACAAAIANITILQGESLVDRVKSDIGPYLQGKWRALADHPLVGEAVMEGLIGSMQLTPDKKARALFHTDAGVGMMTRNFSFQNGLVMRAVGDRMIIAPPLVLTHAEADELIQKVTRTLDMAHAEAKKRGLL